MVVVDLVTILSGLTTNFKIKTLISLPQPSFPPYLSALAATEKWILESNLAKCQKVREDVKCMENLDWQNNAVCQILQCSNAMAGDYWLVSGASSNNPEAAWASHALETMLAPLYGPYCA